MTRLFQVTTAKSLEGIVYGYDKETGQFKNIQINEKLSPQALDYVISNIKANVGIFLSWAEKNKNFTVVELKLNITFEMSWLKYNDKLRSSKKKSEALWSKLSESDQVKQYYFMNTYEKNRGSAEKKYYETYLKAELWNN